MPQPFCYRMGNFVSYTTKMLRKDMGNSYKVV